MNSIRTLIFCLLAATSGVTAQELGWPQELTSESGAVLQIYQPQVEAFSDNLLESRSAISIKIDAAATPVFGAIWMKARIDTDRDTRMAVIREGVLAASAAPWAMVNDAPSGRL